MQHAIVISLFLAGFSELEHTIWNAPLSQGPRGPPAAADLRHLLTSCPVQVLLLISHREDNFHQHHHSIKSPLPPRPKSAGEILDTTGRPVPPSETKADKFATPRIDEGARTPRIGADWPVAQFARKFREEIFRGRHLEKY